MVLEPPIQSKASHTLWCLVLGWAWEGRVKFPHQFEISINVPLIKFWVLLLELAFGCEVFLARFLKKILSFNVFNHVYLGIEILGLCIVLRGKKLSKGTILECNRIVIIRTKLFWMELIFIVLVCLWFFIKNCLELYRNQTKLTKLFCTFFFLSWYVL